MTNILTAEEIDESMTRLQDTEWLPGAIYILKGAGDDSRNAVYNHGCDSQEQEGDRNQTREVG